MGVELNNDDRCAVDLLLERSPTGPQGITSCFTEAPSSDVQQRLNRVEQILHLLDNHTPAEPADDLVARTLARCENRATVGASATAVPAHVAATAR